MPYDAWLRTRGVIAILFVTTKFDAQLAYWDSRVSSKCEYCNPAAVQRVLALAGFTLHRPGSRGCSRAAADLGARRAWQTSDG